MTQANPRALYLLPFDHRHSYLRDMFGYAQPLDEAQHEAVCNSKQVIYEGFQQAVANGLSTSEAGLLVDEEFGALILRDAHQQGYITALPVERSGSNEFHFEYGDDFADHIEAFDPSYVKVLVRYNPEGDPALNARQTARLQRLSRYCESSGRRFMFELLVPATPQQLDRSGGNRQDYDRQQRPRLMERAIRALQDAGVEPDVWKIEGLGQRDDCERMTATARRGGRGHVSCIVLGRGADEAQVEHWLSTAATAEGFIGFAVGRTTFWDGIADYRSGRMGRDEAAHGIAGRYAHWVDVFERARPGRAVDVGAQFEVRS